MSEKQQEAISIWFFIGTLLAFYGVLILGAGVYHLFCPQENDPANNIAMRGTHFDLWMGAFLLLFGGFYSYRFFPRRSSGGNAGKE